MKTTYIYVPGLGGESVLRRQRKTVSSWASDTRGSYFLESDWNNTAESYSQKRTRLSSEIRTNFEPKQPLCIVGTSAGGSLGLNLFAELKSDYQLRFVSIGGKITGSEAIGPHYSEPHPALIPSVEHSEGILPRLSSCDLDRILSIHPLFDEVVHPRYMIIPGAHHKRTRTLTHALSIWWVIRYRPGLIFKFDTTT